MNNKEIMITKGELKKMSKLKLIHNRALFTPCFVCWTNTPCYQHKIGKLKMYLCSRCVSKINLILKEEENLIKELKIESKISETMIWIFTASHEEYQLIYKNFYNILVYWNKDVVKYFVRFIREFKKLMEK